jgi:hypothetical protein
LSEGGGFEIMVQVAIDLMGWSNLDILEIIYIIIVETEEEKLYELLL